MVGSIVGLCCFVCQHLLSLIRVSVTFHMVWEGLFMGSFCLNLRYLEADPETKIQVQAVYFVRQYKQPMVRE